MKRIDYYGRSFTVSDTYAGALVDYVNRRVANNLPFGEFFPMRCYAADPKTVIEVTVQLVAGVPVLVYPADAAFDGIEEIVDDAVALARLAG